jgi:hypothetical protein
LIEAHGDSNPINGHIHRKIVEASVMICWVIARTNCAFEKEVIQWGMKAIVWLVKELRIAETQLTNSIRSFAVTTGRWMSS